MSSKAALSQLEVNERRLKGIYDFLESGNYKKAINESEKVLKKNPNLDSAKVLKAYSLYKTNKSIEAQKLIDEVTNDNPIDETTLNSLAYYYRERNERDKIVEMYEKSCQKNPQREDLWLYLFYNNVRNGNFRSQQRVSTQLKKLNATHTEYGMWPIVSNVLTGVYEDERLIKLGEAMLTKYLSNSSILTSERIQFLIFVLKYQQKYEEAWKVLNDNQYRDVITNVQNISLFNTIKLEILSVIGLNKEACQVYQDELKRRKEDIKLWKGYIDLIVELNLEESGLRIVDLIEEINSLDKTKLSGHLVDIHLSLVLERLEKECSVSSRDKIVNYALRHSSKPSCVIDIYNFLCLLKEEQDRKYISIKLREELAFDGELTNIKDIESICLLETILNAFDGGIVRSDKDLQRLYEEGLKLCGVGPEGGMEILPVDNLVRLRVDRMYEQWISSDKSEGDIYWRMMEVLDEGLSKSRNNYMLCLQKMWLVGLQNCPELMLGLMSHLDLKQIMWESLVGHLVVVPGLSNCQFNGRKALLQRNIHRHSKSMQELEEGMVLCYKLGNYIRLPELLEFKSQLVNGLVIRLSQLEILYIDSVINSHNLDELFVGCSSPDFTSFVDCSDLDWDLTRLYEELCDHRDLEVVPYLSKCSNRPTKDDWFASGLHTKQWVAHRMLLLRCIYAASKLTMEVVVKTDMLCSKSVDMTTIQDVSNHYKMLGNTVKSTQQLMAHPPEDYPRLSNHSIPGCQALPNHIMYSNLSLAETLARMLIGYYDVVFSRPVMFPQDANDLLCLNLEHAVSVHITPMSDDMPSSILAWAEYIAQLTQICESTTIVLLAMCLLNNLTNPLKSSYTTPNNCTNNELRGDHKTNSKKIKKRNKPSTNQNCRDNNVLSNEMTDMNLEAEEVSTTSQYVVGVSNYMRNVVRFNEAIVLLRTRLQSIVDQLATVSRPLKHISTLPIIASDNIESSYLQSIGQCKDLLIHKIRNLEELQSDWSKFRMSQTC